MTEYSRVHAEAAKSSVAHLVDESWDGALCGYRPDVLDRWILDDDEMPTCRRCIKIAKGKA